MAHTPPTYTPSSLIAGITWHWTRDLADYPADTWTLTYYLRSSTGAALITIAGTADGTTHKLLVTSTGSYTAGVYTYQAVVTDGDYTYLVEEGEIEVVAGLASSTADPRSHARKMVDAIRAVIEGRASSDILMYSIGGMQIQQMSPKQLQEWLNFYEARLARETGTAVTAILEKFV